MNKFTQHAFTLIELLVVIAIIGILSGLIIVGMSSSTQSANIAKAQIFSSSLRDSLLISIVSEWKFDTLSSATNGAVIPDSWNGSYNCTLNSGSADVSDKLLSGSNCIYGKCLGLDGNNDYLDCGSPSIPNAITVSAWVKSSYIAANLVAVGRYNGSGGNWWLGFQTGRPHWMGIVYSQITSNWVYLVGTATTSGSSLYVNGNFIGNGSIYNPPGGGIKVASFGDALGYYWNGSIDDVRIYDAAIPTSKIKEQYYSGLNNLLAKREVNKDEYEEKISN